MAAKKGPGVGLTSLASGSYFEPGAFVVLVLGVLLTNLYPSIGGGLVGIVFGLFFGSRILSNLKSIEATYKKLGLYKSLVLLGSLAALFIALPFFFVMAGLSALAATFVMPKGEHSGEEIEVAPSEEE